MDFNPITLFDKHGWFPSLFFGLANWSRKPAKGEVLNYKIGSSVLLNGSAGGKLNCTWENRQIHHLQMVVIFFTNKGSQLIKDRTVLIQCSDGEILEADLNAFPKNEKWQIEQESHLVKIPIGVLKVKEEFSIVLFMQHGSKDSITIESRSELKVQGDGNKFDFTTHKSGFQHGWMMCMCAVMGILTLQSVQQIEAAPPVHHTAFPLVVALIVIRIFGYLAIANAFLGLALNVWYQDWKEFRKKK
jgi:hypothetical protein